MSNLKTLEKRKLLKFKSYGLGKEYLWSLTDDSYIINELGYQPPKSEIHSNMHEHDIGLGDLFVSFMLADLVVMWTMYKRLGKNFIPDRTLETEAGNIYIERETGSQNIGVWREKILKYMKHFLKTKEDFILLFTMKDETAVKSIIILFEELGCPARYYAAVQSDIVNDPINALATNRFSTKKFSIVCSIT